MKKILCIEDDPDFADVIELALGDLYQIRIVSDTKDVMETLNAFIPDLILIDYYIGMVQAADVIKEIKSSSLLKNIPFILCSGHVDIKNISIEISANAYLEKPFDLADLYSIINQVFLASPTV